jgi:hypothetical protein
MRKFIFLKNVPIIEKIAIFTRKAISNLLFDTEKIKKYFLIKCHGFRLITIKSTLIKNGGK